MAEPFEDALDAYNTGDYATALRLWRPLAEQGYAYAEYMLGVMYERGEGAPRDYAEAVKWYRLAAEQDYANAQSDLGFMYDIGRGVPQDDVEAVKWYRRAAEQGVEGAQASLGGMYSQGQGVPQDDVLSYMWLNLAASRFPPGKDRDRATQGRDTLALFMTPTQIAEAQKLALEWKPRGEQAD